MPRSVIEDAINTKLTADQSASSFYDDVGGRISANEATDSKAYPHAIYTVVADVPARAFGGKRDIDAYVDIDLYGAKGATLHLTNNKLYTLLDNASVTITGFTGGVAQCLETGVVTYDDERMQITSRWRLQATES